MLRGITNKCSLNLIYIMWVYSAGYVLYAINFYTIEVKYEVNTRRYLAFVAHVIIFFRIILTSRVIFSEVISGEWMIR